MDRNIVVSTMYTPKWCACAPTVCVHQNVLDKSCRWLGAVCQASLQRHDNHNIDENHQIIENFHPYPEVAFHPYPEVARSTFMFFIVFLLGVCKKK